jgi:hypothetical protein
MDNNLRLGHEQIAKSIEWLTAAGYLAEGEPTESGMIVAPNGMRELIWKGYLSTCFGVSADLVGDGGFHPYSVIRE